MQLPVVSDSSFTTNKYQNWLISLKNYALESSFKKTKEKKFRQADTIIKYDKVPQLSRDSPNIAINGTLIHAPI